MRKSDSSGSASSSTSRISIRIPRKAVNNNVAAEEMATVAADRPAEPESKEGGKESKEEEEEEGEEGDGGRRTRGSSKREKRSRPAVGRRRRGQDDSSEESAYGESDMSEESTESEEVYSGEESEESDETPSEEYDDDEEEWTDRPRKSGAKQRPVAQPSYFVSPAGIPISPYAPMMGGYAPIAPLPPGMANIPMFAKLAAQRPPMMPMPSGAAGAGGAAGPASAVGAGAATPPLLNLTPEQIQEIANNTLNILAARAAASVGGGEVKSSAPSQAAATAAEEGKAATSEAKEATPAVPAAPGAIGSPPVPSAASTGGTPPITAASLQPTPELRETVRTMMASPQWRAALLAKLQMNRAISAEQAAKLGLRPAAPSTIPPLGGASGAPPPLGFPLGRPPMMMRPMMPMAYYNAPMAMRPPPSASSHHAKAGKSKKKKKRTSSLRAAAAQLGSGEDTPIAVRREGRTRKAVDYSKFFKEDELEESEEGSSERELAEGEASGSEGEQDVGLRTRGAAVGGTAAGRRGLAKTRGGRATGRRRDSSDSFDEDDENDEDEDMVASRSSEDFGVEKILSHRVRDDGTNEFLVKFHNLSYIHAEWISEEEMQTEANGPGRIKRFLAKPLSLQHYSEKHPFNPDFTRIDRIVHGWEHPDEHDPKLTAWSYLVKWMALPYSEATWEKRDALLALPDGAEKLAEYERRPSLAERKAKTAPPGWRPDRGEYQNMTESPQYKGGNTLRPYQLEGVNWLLYCWTNRQSCIIADEMGLGKTVQSVAFLELLYNRFSVRGPFLVVAPLSTVPHWEREFEAWTDLNVIVYHGNIPSRDMMYEYEFFYRTADDKTVPDFCKFDVVITTYEMVLAGFEHLQPIYWRAAVCDEAHRLKNRLSKASETLKALQIEHKVLLTGTPLQNNIDELWSLLNFLQPHRFFSEAQFKAEYGNLQRSEDVIRLQELLKPLMLRRLKEDVEKSIPVKEETVVEVELTSVQKRYYRAILERNFAFLTKGVRGTNAPNLINAMMELRKCCIHPYLIKGAEERILTECGMLGGTLDEQMSCMVQASGKLVLVDKLLRRLREHGHRVLIFSQMTRCLDVLVDYLKWRKYPFERIDGTLKGELRQAAIDRFCDPNLDSFVFLLCTRAGGVGINLTAADTVIIFDSDWNPQNDIQAQARCHRIGQTKSVKVYRLLTRNTYEREMFDRAGLKLGLDRAILRKILPNETLEGASHNPQLSKKEVETLLKKGAYGMLMENDEDSIKFCEEDIDQILSRRTTVIRHDGNAQAAAEGGSIFSKASFAAAADDMDIDIDDPNFWELWARRLDLDPRQLLSSSGVVVDEPRIKRQVRRLRTEELGLDELEARLTEEAGKDMAVDGGTASGGEPQLWTGTERARFLHELLRVGIHRFEEMLPRFPGRTKNDLIACTRAVVKHCLEALEGLEDGRLREDNEKLLLAHLDFDRSAVEGEMVDEATGKIDLAAAEMQTEEAASGGGLSVAVKGFSRADIPFAGAGRRQIIEFKSFLREAPQELLDQLTENAKPMLLRLQLLDFIRQLVEGHATVVAQKNHVPGGSGKAKGPGGKKGKGEETTTPAAVAVPEEVEYHLPMPNIVGSAPTRGWGKAEDEALVVGIYKYGFGRYEEIHSKTAIFADYQLADADSGGKEGPVEEERAAVAAGEGEEEGGEEGGEEEAAAAPPALPTEKGVGKWPSRQELDARLKKVVLAMEKRTQAAAKLAIQAMNAAQGARRRTVTVGDDDDEAYEEDQYQQPEEGRRRKSRGGAGAGSSSSGGRGSTAPGGLSTRWVKRDRTEFQRTVVNFGLPEESLPGHRDWTFFREHASFAPNLVRAGDSAFDEYCTLFVKGCKASTEKRGGRRRGKGRGKGEEGEETVTAEAEADEEEDEEDEDAPLGVISIPPEKARKALARIDLFHRLRSHVLALPDLEEYMQRSRKTSGLPSWWETPLHDAALLRAAGKYGLGRWDLVVLDEDLPFRQVYQTRDPDAFVGVEGVSVGEPAAPEAPRRGRRSKKTAVVAKGLPSGAPIDLSKIEWPAETTITRRIETLIEMIANEERRRARAAEESGTGSKPKATGKRRRSAKSKAGEGSTSQADGHLADAAEGVQEPEAQEGRDEEGEDSTPEPAPKKGRRNAGRQRSILDYASK